VDESLIAEEVRGSPQELNTGAALRFFKFGDDSIEVLVRLTAVLRAFP